MSRNKRKQKPKVGQAGQLSRPTSGQVALDAEAERYREDVKALEKIPSTYQGITYFFTRYQTVQPFVLRQKTFAMIEAITNRPLICYVARTNNLVPGIPVSIDDSDITGFKDMVNPISEKVVDIFLVSNGGSAEATERIVALLRSRFEHIRFIVPANAFSAATLMTFAGDEIVMDDMSTLGPIDPQIGGIPARAILKAFEEIEEKIKKDGIQALAPYGPLIQKYDLHLIQICRVAELLSRELAEKWLSQFMFRGWEGEAKDKGDHVSKITDFFSDYDYHKSHSRGINRTVAKEKGFNIIFVETMDPDLQGLYMSLYNQYQFLFDKSGCFKQFENNRGINWGRQASVTPIQVPIQGPPQPRPISPQQAR